MKCWVLKLWSNQVCYKAININLVGGWTNPFEKYYIVKLWIISPSRGWKWKIFETTTQLHHDPTRLGTNQPMNINKIRVNQLSQLLSTNQWTSWVNKQSEWIDRHIGISAFHPQQRQEFPTIRVPPGVPNDASTTQPQLVGGFNPCWKILAKMGIFPKLGSN